ncbi:MAG TPA: hypothetical protein VGD66_12770 [Allosphingosinicella sp.]|jgi:hypothetical protein
MADGQHKLSRRALLGAVCAAPVLSRHPGLDPRSILLAFSSPRSQQRRWIPDQVRDDESSQSSAVLKWDRALARFAAAEAATAAAAGAPDFVYDPIGARHHVALRRLLRTPAPNLAALARKLDLALDERTVEFDGDAAAMKALKQDAMRLMACPPDKP